MFQGSLLEDNNVGYRVPIGPGGGGKHIQVVGPSKVCIGPLVNFFF